MEFTKREMLLGAIAMEVEEIGGKFRVEKTMELTVRGTEVLECLEVMDRGEVFTEEQAVLLIELVDKAVRKIKEDMWLSSDRAANMERLSVLGDVKYDLEKRI